MKGKITVLKKEYLAKMLVMFGVVALFNSIISIIVLAIPFQFKVPKWVFMFSQEISERSIFPILAILVLIGGVYICNSAKECKESKCRCAVWAEKLSAAFCIIFFTGLITIAFVYTFNLKALQSDIKTQIQGEAEKVKTQITMMIQRNNPQIEQENVQNGIRELNERAAMEIKKANKSIIINSIKILAGLISFAILYLITAIYLIKISISENK
jgi:hypothetical protein